MNQLRTLPLVAALVGLAACSDAPSAVAPPSLARTTVLPTADRYLVRLAGPAARFTASVQALGGTVAYLHGEAGLAIVSGLSGERATALGGNATVAEIIPDVQVSLDLAQEPVYDAVDAVASQANPTTASRYPWQWNMRAIGADKAWAAGKLGSPDVKVAILDTGIDYDALDLNGLVDLTRSASFVPRDDSITAVKFPSRQKFDDYHGHGTNVASQVSSKALAIAGVTSKTTLMAVKVLGTNGSSQGGSVLQGVLFAADNGADVINMSLGGAFTRAGNGRYVGFVNQVFNYATRKGALIVVAAGNESTDLDHNLVPDSTGTPQHVPGLYAGYCDTPAVVCVSSVGKETWAGSADVPAFYTNFGRSAITVAAPGGNAQFSSSGTIIPSVWPWGADIASWVWSICAKNRLTASGQLTACVAGNRLTGMIGTSQASPHVAGLAALLVAEMGHGNPAQIKAAIQQSADDIVVSGTDPFSGKGRINVAHALGLD